MIAEYESADRPAHSKLDAPKSYGLGLAHKLSLIHIFGGVCRISENSFSLAYARQLPLRGSRWQNRKLYRTAKASLIEGGGIAKR